MTGDGARYRTGDSELDRRIDELLDAAEVGRDRDLSFELVAAALRMGREGLDRLDLKIANTTLREMHAAFHVFGPYRDLRKVAMFGSARTGAEEPAYRAAVLLGRAVSDAGWMLITGGGPGIMTAGVEGAGPEDSFAVNIVLPFEPAGGGALLGEGRTVNFRYFFNRKVTFMREASGYLLLPGGFGTMDEAFELLTLLQTGREVPAPVVLFEPPGDAYWRQFRHFLDVELLDAGLIEREDLDLFHLTSDVDDAVDHLTGFYRVFHSLRHVGGRLVLRLTIEPTDAQLDALNQEFGDIVAAGVIERCGPSRAEVADDDATDLPRIRFRFVNARYARLHALIRRVNTF